MLIADSQVHIWGADTPERPWPAGRAHQAQKPYPVTKDMLLKEMDAAGVSRVVIVPPSWEGERNDLGLEAADLEWVMGRGVCEWLGWPLPAR
jgi:predicted TIM-barrel fold metal-dependent hydrolase